MVLLMVMSSDILSLRMEVISIELCLLGLDASGCFKRWMIQEVTNDSSVRLVFQNVSTMVLGANTIARTSSSLSVETDD